jgi:hypothetical protein
MQYESRVNPILELTRIDLQKSAIHFTSDVINAHGVALCIRTSEKETMFTTNIQRV